MSRHNETPLLTGKVSNGGSVFEKVWGPDVYRNPPLPSKELAIAHVARRFRLSRPLAAVVIELAGLGGRRG